VDNDCGGRKQLLKLILQSAGNPKPRSIVRDQLVGGNSNACSTHADGGSRFQQ
jgi:hypothetical protein